MQHRSSPSSEAKVETRRSRRASSADKWLRAYALLRSGFLTAAAVLGAGCIVAFAVALILGIRPVVVISGSMEPELSVGSAVFVRPVPASDVSVGDIVTVERPRNLGLVTHRVVNIQSAAGGTLELKGDANAQPDPEPYTVTTAGLYVAHVPGLGYITLFLQSPQGLLAGAGMVVVMVSIFFLDPGRLGTLRTAPTRRP